MAVNDDFLFFSSSDKYIFLIISQLCSKFWGRQNKYFQYTPLVLNLTALSFQNSFSFGSSSYQKIMLSVESLKSEKEKEKKINNIKL